MYFVQCVCAAAAQCISEIFQACLLACKSFHGWCVTLLLQICLSYLFRCCKDDACTWHSEMKIVKIVQKSLHNCTIFTDDLYYDLLCITIYHSQNVKQSTISNEIEMVDCFTEWTYVNCSTINKLLKAIYFIMICITIYHEKPYQILNISTQLNSIT